MFHGFQGELMQASAAVRYILDDLLAHARLPEFFEMVGDARDGFIVRVSGEKERDLIRHVDHVFRFHKR